MATLKPKLDGTVLTTGLVRTSYCFLTQPKIDDKGDKKFQTAIIIPKSDTETLSLIDKAFEAAKIKGFEKGKLVKADIEGKKKLKTILRDGDTESNEPAYADSYFMNVSNLSRPRLKDRKGNDIEDPDEIYSGCFVRVILNFYAYNSEGAKGLTASLEAVQKVKDGENLAGGIDVDAYIDAIEGDEDDPLFD